jgi:Tfp pilus assembly protein PilF
VRTSGEVDFRIMRRLFSWQLSALLLVAMTAAALDNPNQSSQAPGNPPAVSGAPPSVNEATAPTVTVTAPRHEQPLPTLPPDEFTDCMARSPTPNLTGSGRLDPSDMMQMEICNAQHNSEMHVVFEACSNHKGNTALPRVIQACTELLDHKVLEGRARFFLFASRADAYFAHGDKQLALDDYNEAVKLAARNAHLYYNRGIFYAAQSDDDAALRDFDTALSIDPKLVLALRQRAIIYLTQKNFSGALADFSEALTLQPKTAALWSERGYVCILLRDYASAVKDEDEAIRLDAKLARAYFLRGAAFGDLGDSGNAYSNIVTAVGLDPSLDHFISTKDKTASLMLPPL